jgi:hypothetical protein
LPPWSERVAPGLAFIVVQAFSALQVAFTLSVSLLQFVLERHSTHLPSPSQVLPP